MASKAPSGAPHPYDVTIYIPCHFDLSQVEFVAPFLQRYGGKVFVYKWLVVKDKITEYYSDRDQYPNVSVDEFSVSNIVNSILQEEKKVVFLLTASMAYAFGPYQRSLLQAIQKRLPDRVAGVNIIGHCMYGCASCKGADHKLPVYFTRYFNERLPYNAAQLRQRYLPHARLPGAPISVLVAPSTGSTTFLVQPTIMALVHRMQLSGRFQFVFKLHPTAYAALVDPSYDATDLENSTVKFIMQNFDVTDERQPCLLPFFEAFDIILCDLHSTVPFMASFFAPKVVLAHHNDADYDVPDRDPEFMAGLNTFDNAEQLEALLASLPTAKGNAKFFERQYGKPDGTEDLRYAALAKWPLTADKVLGTVFATNLAPQRPITTKYNRREVIAYLLEDYRSEMTSAGYVASGKTEENEETRGDCANAIGLPWEWCPSPDFFTDKRIAPSSVHGLSTSDVAAKGETVLRVMSFNLWHGGEKGGLPLSATADAIKRSGADIVGLQETAGNERPDGTRVDNAPVLAAQLGWHCAQLGIPIPSPATMHPLAVISRWPIGKKSKYGFGVQITVPAATPSVQPLCVWAFTAHLPYTPYQPYQLCGIPYHEAPMLRTAEEAIASANATRASHVQRLIDDIRESCHTDDFVFLTGDFNEPSHRDWTDEAALAGVHPLTCKWPSTEAIERQLGLVDTYALLRSDEVRRPGLTWCSVTKQLDKADHWDRIDFVFAGRAQASSSHFNFRVTKAVIVGECPDEAEEVLAPWPSDHRAMLAELRLARKIDGL